MTEAFDGAAMDTFSKALMAAAKMIEDGLIDGMVKKRWALLLNLPPGAYFPTP